MTTEIPENIDLSWLRETVRRDLDEYVYEVPEGSMGNPKSVPDIADELSQMWAALIEPYWTMVEVRDTFEQIGAQEPLKRRCAAVADDGKGIVLLFDPHDESFVLAQRTVSGLATFGVRGDAVGCFLSR